MLRPQSLSLPRVLQVNLWPIGLSALLLALFAWVQTSTTALVGVDGYYHLKMAAILRDSLLQGDPTPTFHWLPLTILNPQQYVDHHWLFHVLLTPFTGGDLVMGGQIATVVFGAAALFAAGMLLRGQGVQGAALWTVLIFAASSAFIYRMSMARAQSLSLLWLLVALHLLFTRRDKWLLPLGISYVWLYNAFPLLLLVVGIYFVAARLTEGEWRWQPIVYAALGLGLGLIVNPYFPDNLLFIYHHLVAKLDVASSVPLGSEWYPYDTAQLLQNSGIALLAMVGGALAMGWQRERMSLQTATTFGLSLVFGLMLMQSRRFVEYFPPFAVLFCAFACQPFLANLIQRKAAMAVAVAAVGLAAVFTGVEARELVAGSTPADHFEGASRWLETNTPKGSVVFQTDWDDFTRLFFYNTHNVYIVGLDPTYLERADLSQYYLWVDLTQGRGLDLAQTIQQNFNTNYVVSDLKHTAFLDRAATDPAFTEVYRDESSVVFEITH
jgi:hypothetical protein